MIPLANYVQLQAELSLFLPLRGMSACSWKDVSLKFDPAYTSARRRFFDDSNSGFSHANDFSPMHASKSFLPSRCQVKGFFQIRASKRSLPIVPTDFVFG